MRILRLCLPYGGECGQMDSYTQSCLPLQCWVLLMSEVENTHRHALST